MSEPRDERSLEAGDRKVTVGHPDKVLFLDDLRNAYGQSAIAPYAVRARPGAPIATPIRWEEVDGDLHPRRYHIGNILRRMGQARDPWRDIARHACRLPTTAGGNGDDV